MSLTASERATIRVNDSLNRQMTKFGVDYRLLFGVLVFSILIFLAGARFTAVLLLFVTVLAGKLATRKDPKMFYLWAMSIIQSAHYDPGKVN